jgi:eukaryotic-like serine/threonine-protein kinase
MDRPSRYARFVDDAERDLPTASGTPTQTLDQSAVAPALGGGRLAANERVGRYEIIDVLGTGGMAVVYRARDPYLSREVALKLLRDGTRGVRTGRLLREAQALAQLSHPNVVAAFDVGTHDDQVFLAMELVEGVTLRAWCARPHTRDQVWRVLIGAGRGLAAAHAAEILHRDFKPGNLVIAADGRARVVDFGLARAEVTEAATPDPDEPATLDDPKTPLDEVARTSSSVLSSELTRAGTTMGTPGYMAPEQLAGRAVDARADQFSYAATVFFALAGRDLFDAPTLDHYQAALVRGERRSWPAHVPAKIRRIVDRGLLAEASARYPKLEDMVDALERATRPRRWWAAGLAAAAAATAAAATYLVAPAAGPTCEVDPAAWTGVWSAARRTELERAFVATGHRDARSLAAAAADRLDRYRDKWTELALEACRTARRGVESDRLSVLRAACFGHKRDQAAALVEVLLAADRQVADRSVAAVSAIDTLAECDDPRALLGDDERLPADPVKRAAVAAIEARLDHVRALQAAGRWTHAVTAAAPVIADAERVQHAPTIANARYVLAEVQNDLGSTDESLANHQTALALASTAGMDRMIAMTSVGMIDNLEHNNRIADAFLLLPLVRAHVERLPALSVVRADQLRVEGEILKATGRYDESRARLRSAQDLYHRLGHRREMEAVNGLGGLAFAQGHFADAVATFREAIAMQREYFPSEIHPRVLRANNNAAMAAAELGDPATFEAIVGRSRRIASELPPDDSDVLYMKMLEGRAAQVRGRCDEAIAAFRAVLPTFEAVLGQDDFDTSTLHAYLGECLLATGEPRAALAHFAVARRVRTAISAAPREIATAAWSIAKTHRALGDHAAATAASAEAVAILRADGSAGSLQLVRQIEEWAQPPR